MKSIYLILSLLTLTISPVAFASIFIEPGLGWESSTFNIKTNSGSGSYQSQGPSLALRGGANIYQHYWLAVDFKLMSGGKADSFIGSSDSDLSRTDVFIDLGMSLTHDTQFWLGYGLLNSREYDSSSGTKTTIEKGTNLLVGLGWMATPKISLNLEVLYRNPSDYSNANSSGSISSLYSKHEETGFILSASYPISL